MKFEELFKDIWSERSEKNVYNVPAFSDEMRERIYSRIQRKQVNQENDCTSNVKGSVLGKLKKKIFGHITNNTENFSEEVQVNGVEIYHRPKWSKLCSAVLSLAMVAVTALGGNYYYSQLKNIRFMGKSIESDTTLSNDENTFTPIPVNEDYKGAILGVENWHIFKQPTADYYMINEFINDDTGYSFVDYMSYSDELSSYLADLDNDGDPELICNTAYGIISGNPHYYTEVYRCRNGMIECGRIKDDFEFFAEEKDPILFNPLICSYKYDYEKNKIILTSKNTDKEYDLGIESFTFYPIGLYLNNPIKIDNEFHGSVLGVKNWHIEKERISSDTENICFTDDNTGETFIDFSGYIDKTSAYLADLDKDGILELICNCQYGDSQEAMNDHVKIYRINNGVLECGEFSDFEAFEKANNIELDNYNDFSEKYDPSRNKIILKKQGNNTEYELGMEYFRFKQVDFQSKT